MKFTANVECTPEEARAFFGLPDVSHVNKVIMDGIEERTRENLDAFTDPQKFYDKMMSASVGNMEVFQKMFSSMMTGQSDK